MDVLTGVLNALELKGWLSSRRELAPPWRYDFTASKDSMFHVISFGGACLQVEGAAEPVRVEDSDVVLFPTGHPHSLYDDPMSPLTHVVHLDYNRQRGHQVIDSEDEGPKLRCSAELSISSIPVIFHCSTVSPNSSMFPGHRGVWSKASLTSCV